MKDKLKPCPFCGGYAIFVDNEDGICSRKKPKLSIGCTMADTFGDCIMLKGAIYTTRQQAITAWNRRSKCRKKGG